MQNFLKIQQFLCYFLALLSYYLIFYIFFSTTGTVVREYEEVVITTETVEEGLVKFPQDDTNKRNTI